MLNKEALRVLKERIPYEDVVTYISGLEDEKMLWSIIDRLPVEIASEVHKRSILRRISAKEFMSDTFTPALEKFWAANQISKGKTPMCPSQQILERIDDSKVEEFLSSRKELAELGLAPIKLLIDVIKADGYPGILFPNIDVRTAYLEFSSLSGVTLGMEAEIETLMKSISFRTKAEMMRELKNYSKLLQDGSTVAAIGKKIPEFEIPEPLFQQLGELQKSVQSFYVKAPIEIEIQNEWVSSRAAALVAQMDRSFQQRNAFVLTPEMLQARIDGQSEIEDVFEKYSIPELLFSNEFNEYATLPFVGTVSGIQSDSPHQFCDGVVKKFVAEYLIGQRYKSASSSCLDILSDLLLEYIDVLADNVITIQKAGGEDQLQNFVKAMRDQGLDIYKE